MDFSMRFSGVVWRNDEMFIEKMIEKLSFNSLNTWTLQKKFSVSEKKCIREKKSRKKCSLHWAYWSHQASYSQENTFKIKMHSAIEWKKFAFCFPCSVLCFLYFVHFCCQQHNFISDRKSLMTLHTNSSWNGLWFVSFCNWS